MCLEHVYILNLDGGGVKAIIPLAILRVVQKILGKKKIQETFHVYSGASAGGILTSALNILGADGQFRYSPDELMTLYKSMSEEIFQVSWKRKITSLGGLLKSKFDGQKKLQVLRDFYGNLKMEELGNTVLINAFDPYSNGTYIFGSNFNTMPGGEKLLVAEVANATSAAPVMFSSALVQPPSSGKAYNLVDGGIVANNPELIAYMVASSLHPKAKIHMLSLGTGTAPDMPDAKKTNDWGVLQWLTKGDLIDDFLSGGMTLSDELLRQVTGKTNLVQYLRLEPALPESLESAFKADPAYLDALDAFATKFAKKNEQTLKAFLAHFV